MITSEIIKIDFTNDNELIEAELHKLSIDPLRWAVVDSDGIELTLSVSFEC